MIEKIKLDLKHPLEAANEVADKLNEVIEVVNSLNGFRNPEEEGANANEQTQAYS